MRDAFKYLASLLVLRVPLMRRLALVLPGLGILRFLFDYLGTVSAPLGFRHGINAPAISGAAAFLAHRAWTRSGVAVAAA